VSVWRWRRPRYTAKVKGCSPPHCRCYGCGCESMDRPHLASKARQALTRRRREGGRREAEERSNGGLRVCRPSTNPSASVFMWVGVCVRAQAHLFNESTRVKEGGKGAWDARVPSSPCLVFVVVEKRRSKKVAALGPQKSRRKNARNKARSARREKGGGGRRMCIVVCVVLLGVAWLSSLTQPQPLTPTTHPNISPATDASTSPPLPLPPSRLEYHACRALARPEGECNL